MPRDERVDKTISWALAFLVASSIGWLTTEVRSMRIELERLGRISAVVDAAKYGDRIDRLAMRVDSDSNRILVLETRVK